MTTRRLILLAAALAATGAHADVWRWVDASGNTHYVDSDRPIYMWVDDGKVYYADKPDHEDAISVELVWHSKGDLADIDESGDGYAHAGETAEERAEREAVDAYFCKRATEIRDSYKNAPRLYRTNESGEREYLSDEEMAKTIADAEAATQEYCG